MALRDRDRPLVAVIVAGAMIALLIIAGLGARELPGTTRSARLAITVDLLEWTRIVLGIAFIALLVWLLIRGQRGERQQRGKAVSRSRWLPLLIALVLIAILAFFIPRSLKPAASDEAVGAPPSQTEFVPLPAERIGSGWVVLALLAVVGLTAAGVILLTKRREEEVVATSGEADVAAALTGAIDALEWSDDPRSVVIKAYVDIEAALASRGLPRRPAEAPREFLVRVLASFEVSATNANRLTTLFEVARFSLHDVGEVDAQEAVSVMQSVRDELIGVSP